MLDDAQRQAKPEEETGLQEAGALVPVECG